jgi:hypothetical protein
MARLISRAGRPICQDGGRLSSSTGVLLDCCNAAWIFFPPGKNRPYFLKTLLCVAITPRGSAASDEFVPK